MHGTFRSLNGFNYRGWAGGAIVSNVGTWMQRTAQDWLVLTQLTHNNATVVGIVMALQFAPLLLLLPVTGFAADHLDRRFLLIGTQVRAGPRPVISHSSDEGLFLYYPRRASAPPEVFLALEDEINGRPIRWRTAATVQSSVR